VVDASLLAEDTQKPHFNNERAKGNGNGKIAGRDRPCTEHRMEVEA
jgi:hypothetical protein